MEKRTPHQPLSMVQGLIRAGRVRPTSTALASAAAMEFSFADMCAVLLTLRPKDFYKSMTTHADHRVWQDVYRPMTDKGAVYLKLTVRDDVLIVSFKEL